MMVYGTDKETTMEGDVWRMKIKSIRPHLRSLKTKMKKKA